MGEGLRGDWFTIVKPSDQSLASSVVLQDDNKLQFPTISGVPYLWDCFLIYGSPAGGGTPDIKVALGIDSTFRGGFLYMGINTGETGYNWAAQGAQLNAPVLFGTAAANRPLYFRGHILGDGNLFKVQWAQNTSNINPTIVRAGSFLRFRGIK